MSVVWLGVSSELRAPHAACTIVALLHAVRRECARLTGAETACSGQHASVQRHRRVSARVSRSKLEVRRRTEQSRRNSGEGKRAFDSAG